MIVVAGAGWYFGRGATVALAAASVIALGALAYAQNAGWLPEPPPSNPLFRWLTQAIVFAVGALLVVGASRAMAIRLQALDSARRALAAALKDSAMREAQLRLIAENVPAMLFYGGRDMRCIWANAAYARFMNLAQESLPGTHVRDIVGETVFGQARPYIERVLAGEAVQYETIRQIADGEARQLAIDLVPDRDGAGAARGWFGLVRDVTERRRREQLLPSLVKGTVRATGDAFFSSLVTQLGGAFGVAYALVAKTTEDNARAQPGLLGRRRPPAQHRL